MCDYKTTLSYNIVGYLAMTFFQHTRIISAAGVNGHLPICLNCQFVFHALGAWISSGEKVWMDMNRSRNLLSTQEACNFFPELN
jgi:hypothetical protein